MTLYQKFLADLARHAEIKRVAHDLAVYRASTGKSLEDILHEVEGYAAGHAAAQRLNPAPFVANRFARSPGQCEAKTTDGRDCWRGGRYNGLCYQHDYMKRKGKWDVRWGKAA